MNATINRQAFPGEQMRSISKEQNIRESIFCKSLFPYLQPVFRCVNLPQTGGGWTARTALRSEDI